MTLVDVLLVAAPLVLVPLARPLLEEDPLPRPALSTTAAVCFAIAFALDETGWPAVLAAPWLVTALWGFSKAVLRWRMPTLAHLAAAVASAFLVVGAFFSLASRAGWTVVGIGEPIVQLTGVHFHYAGFATVVLAGALARSGSVPKVVAATTLSLGVVGPPIVASGFTWTLPLPQIGGAIVMTAFTWALAGATMRYVVPRVTGIGRVLLVVSSLSVVAPMILAVFWAAAQYYDVPALSVPAMARTHGVINAVGFVGCGLFGWRYADLRSAITRRQRSGSLR